MRLGAAVVLLAAAAFATACSSDGDDALAHYTDPGDACAQTVSAIAYADDKLLALGQEPYQPFTDEVRSRLAAVAGTVALEKRDWPDRTTRRQAEILQPLAQKASDPAPDGDQERIRTLLEYRFEATRMVLLCRDATG